MYGVGFSDGLEIAHTFRRCFDLCGGTSESRAEPSLVAPPFVNTDNEGEYFTYPNEILEAAARATPSCDKLCHAPRFAEQECVTPEEAVAHGSGSELQRRLDAACQAEFQRICTSSNRAAHCNVRTVVARKESGQGVLGIFSMFQKPQWRCFSFAHFGLPNKSICVDDCGEEVECNGGAVGAASTVHVTWDQIPAKIQELKAELCRK